MDEFRVLVTGSRNWSVPAKVHLVLTSVYCDIVGLGKQMVLVEGECPDSPDEYSVDWADQMIAMGFSVVVDPHPADWEKFGRGAGYRRNAEMVKLGADICLAFIHNESKGASHTAALADKAAIRTVVFEENS